MTYMADRRVSLTAFFLIVVLIRFVVLLIPVMMAGMGRIARAIGGPALTVQTMGKTGELRVTVLLVCSVSQSWVLPSTYVLQDIFVREAQLRPRAPDHVKPDTFVRKDQ